MSRAMALLFATICYAIFFATFLYLIVFVGDLSFATNHTVDLGPSASPLTAAVIDLLLIALFGVQHSVMARPAFKAQWTRVVPKVAERSMFVLASSIALIVLFLFWHPIDTIIWSTSSRALSGVLWLLFWAGFLTVLVSTFLINHFELFGLQQAWFHGRSDSGERPQLREPSLYRLVRHPMMAGFFLAFWATPEMTAGHLLLALGMSLYILIALHYEERDLIGLFGGDYENYRSRVGMLVPRFRRRGA
jgi:protein-S-isoprenylcysteine O-methyltransferase Ste14